MRGAAHKRALAGGVGGGCESGQGESFVHFMNLLILSSSIRFLLLKLMMTVLCVAEKTVVSYKLIKDSIQVQLATI